MVRFLPPKGRCAPYLLATTFLFFAASTGLASTIHHVNDDADTGTNWSARNQTGPNSAYNSPRESLVAAAPVAEAAQAQRPPEGLSRSDWSSIRAAYEANRHAAFAVDSGYEARNPGQQWRTRFDGRGFKTTPEAGGWSWGLELVGFGRGDALRAVTAPTCVEVRGGRVEYEWHESLSEWFINDLRGLEHGYTVHRRPADAGTGASSSPCPFQLTLAVRGGLQPHVSGDGRGITFVNDAGAAVVNYSGLKVFDADGAEVPAWFADSAVPRASSLQPTVFSIIVDDTNAAYPLTIDPIAQQAYLKASNTDAGDSFGTSLAVSGDTVVVGAASEDSNASGVNGNQANNSASASGAAYVFVRSGGVWSQQAYLKASNTEANDFFGYSVAISGDTVVVGAIEEDSNASGVNGNQANNSASASGAAYVFVRSGGVWSQQAYLKASNTGVDDKFGISVAASGNTVVVGAHLEDSNASGVNGNQADNSAASAGAVYVFERTDGFWTQQAYLKASNTGASDFFGLPVAVSADTVVVGADGEDSNTTGVNGFGGNNSASFAGAAYVFVRSSGVWSQQAYLKASNTGTGDRFGGSVGVSADTVVVGAYREESSATGVDGSQSDNSAPGAGAAYVFVRNGGVWSQQAYLKASNTDPDDLFGESIAISGDTVVVGASWERSSATGVNGNQTDNSAWAAGAVYVFVRNGAVWSQQAYLKASNTDDNEPGSPNDRFGESVAISGDTLVVGALGEDSSATGVNGNQASNSASGSGAAYVFLAPGTRYVHAGATGGNNGTSWIDAYTSLQTAVSVAIPGDQIWVTAGTHKPAGYNGSRAATFQLLSDVAIYGGFAGIETQLSQRNVAANTTILSGDLNSDDNGELNLSDNSLHVVFGDGVNSSSIIDGFTIQAGNSNSGGNGGGVHLINAASPVIRNCTISSNRAGYGAGLFCYTNCNAAIDSCRFENNIAESSGGGIYMNGASPTLKNCAFQANSAPGPAVAQDLGGGGAAWVLSNSDPAFIQCQFIANTAGQGAGLSIQSDSDVVLLECTFLGGVTTYQGGGVWVQTNSSVNAIGCVFSGNRFYPLYFQSNSQGGQPSNGTLTNCTIASNIGEVFLANSANVTIQNCILWGNQSGAPTVEQQQLNLGGQPPALSVNYSIVQGWTGNYGGIGNNGNDPMFLDAHGPDSIAGTLDDNLALGPGSAAIDSGNSLAVPLDNFDIDGDSNTSEQLPIDLAGNPRFVDDPNVANTGPGSPPHVDRGAYENNLSNALWISPTGGVFNDAGNWQGGVVANVNTRAIFGPINGSTQLAYQVNYPNSTSLSQMYQLWMQANDITFNLQSGTGSGNYQLLAPSTDPTASLLISGPNTPGSTTKLTLINNHTSTRSLSGSTCTIADTPGSEGELDIRGLRSAVQFTGAVRVGKAAGGTLTIRERSQSSTVGSLILGTQSSGAGEVKVLGQSFSLISRLEYGGATSGELIVGDAGTGTITFSAGGQLRSSASGVVDRVVVGRQADSSGTVNLAGAGAVWDNVSTDFIVGDAGAAVLNISGGALLTTTTSNSLILGRNASASAAVTIGSGSAWTETLQSVTIGNSGTASITVMPGGALNFEPGLRALVNGTGTLKGGGDITGDVRNFGTVQPEGSTPGSIGTLTITGDYEQVGAAPSGGSASGKLNLKVGGQSAGEYDQLVINNGGAGAAKLGGGLFVELINVFQPTGPINIPLVTAQGISLQNPRFDVAFFPGIAGNRFLTVRYPTAPRGSTNTVELITVPLSSEIFLTDPEGATVNGEPTAVARLADTDGDLNGDTSDVDGDGDDDLVITVRFEGQPGQVVVLLTEFDEGGNYNPPAGQVYNVGEDPSAVVLGNFDASPGLDIAVANEADDNVMLLKNDGTGTFIPVDLSTTFNVGTAPRGLATADFESGNGADLLVANHGSDSLTLLGNNGAGNFVATQTLATDIGPVMAEPVDPDQDKDIDFCVISDGDGVLSVFENQNDTYSPIASVNVGADPVQVVARNLNGLGIAGNSPDDLVVVNRGSGTVSVLVFSPTMEAPLQYAPPVELPLRDMATQTSDPTSIAAIDLDEDDDLDLAVVTKTDDNADRIVRVLRNDQTFTDADPLNDQLAFSPADPQAAGTNPIAVVASDLDADGNNDLVTVNETTFALLAGGHQSVGKRSTRGTTPSGVTLRLTMLRGDMNCDNVLDFLDVAPFANALVDAALQQGAFPGCDITHADMNRDAAINGADVSVFVPKLMP